MNTYRVVLVTVVTVCFLFVLCCCGAVLVSLANYKGQPPAPETEASKEFKRDMMFSRLFDRTQPHVKKTLNFPDTAVWKNAETDSRWAKRFSSGQHAHLYVIRGAVQAKNAFGVPSTVEYEADWKVPNNNTDRASLVRLVVDGNAVVLDSDEWAKALLVQPQ